MGRGGEVSLNAEDNARTEEKSVFLPSDRFLFIIFQIITELWDLEDPFPHHVREADTNSRDPSVGLPHPPLSPPRA
jgi:hypothetical protein